MSKLEAMAYKLQPAGHEEPPQQRKYTEPDRKLKEAFEKWMKGKWWDREEGYEIARSSLEGLEPSVEEAHALLLDRQDSMDQYKWQFSGCFISAVYNASPEKIVIHDFEVENPPEYVGFKLSKEKCLVNRAKAGGCMGFEAEGTLINYGETEDCFAFAAKGPVINYGKVNHPSEEEQKNYKRGSGMGHDATGLILNLGKTGVATGYGNKSVVLNLGDAYYQVGDKATGIVVDIQRNENLEYTERAKLVVKPRDYKGAMKNYLDNLCMTFEPGRTDHNAAIKALEELGPEPEKTIELDIKKALGIKYPFKRLVQKYRNWRVKDDWA